MSFLKEKAWASPQTQSPNKTSDKSKFTSSSTGVARGGYRRELLPDPFSWPVEHMEEMYWPITGPHMALVLLRPPSN